MQIFFCKIAESKFPFFLCIFNTSLMVFLRPPKLVTSFRDKSRKKLAPPMRIGLSWVPPIFCWTYPFSSLFFWVGAGKIIGGRDYSISPIDKYLRPVSHSSLVSDNIALTSLKSEASFGKSVATRVLRLISLFSLSTIFVERNFFL